jgi:integrase
MLKFLLYTSVRVNELVNIKVGDVDLGNCKVFINQGKGSKDRYILFPESFRLVLASHLSANPNNKHLFQSRHFKAYTPRRIQQIMREYGQRAGLGDRVHPHLFRHQMITALTRNGLSDAQIQLISGHGSKKSLEIYQHLGLEAVDVKTEPSIGDVQIDPELMSVFRGYYAARAGSSFVIEVGGSADLSPPDGSARTFADHYRAKAVFERLSGWLRAHGVTARKPIHELRKEFGSMVNRKHGLSAASDQLRHSGIATTAAYYMMRVRR